MNKALAYITAAIVLGLVMTLIPTWFFVVKANRDEKLGARTSAWKLPLLDYSEQNRIETVSSRDVEILSISFIVASIVYVLFKRRIHKHDYIWPLIRPY
ncbi:MAG: hypothetical protein ACE5KD_00985 [Candidatus Bathyarchaeia archaeon]